MGKLNNIVLMSLGGGAIALASASSITLSSSVRSIEVHFFDQDNSEKTIRFSIEYPSNPSYWESKKDSKFENFRNVNSSDRNMYSRLFDIGHKYVEFQHYMNLVKTHKTPSNSVFCCNSSQKSDCKCKDNKCCMCVCCYLDDKNCCCKNPSQQCKSEEFLKIQKTFSYFLSNIYSGHNNIYLTPVQAYIKFSDIKFDNLSTESTEKSFIGSLAYGFSDYWYKPVAYNSKIIPSNLSSEFTNLSSEKYFANIPQKLKFKKDSSEGDSEVNINKLFKKVNKYSDLAEFLKKEITSEENCCEDKFECLLNRNFVFSETLAKIQEKIKNLQDCCK